MSKFYSTGCFYKLPIEATDNTFLIDSEYPDWYKYNTDWCNGCNQVYHIRCNQTKKGINQLNLEELNFEDNEDFNYRYINSVKKQCNTLYNRIKKYNLKGKNEKELKEIKQKIKDIKKSSATIYREMTECSKAREIHGTTCFLNKTDPNKRIESGHEHWYKEINDSVKLCKSLLSLQPSISFSRPRSLYKKHSPLSQSRKKYKQNKPRITIPKTHIKSRSITRNKTKKSNSIKRTTKKKRSSYH